MKIAFISIVLQRKHTNSLNTYKIFMLLIFPKHILKKTSLYTLFSLQYKNHVIIKIFIVSIPTLN